MPSSRTLRAAVLGSVLIASPCLAQGGGQAPPATDLGARPGTLSEKLNETSGVIHPRGGVDPGMAEKPPEATGAMPVVPPPGSPGGRTDVVPK